MELKRLQRRTRWLCPHGITPAQDNPPSDGDSNSEPDGIGGIPYAAEPVTVPRGTTPARSLGGCASKDIKLVGAKPIEVCIQLDAPLEDKRIAMFNPLEASVEGIDHAMVQDTGYRTNATSGKQRMQPVSHIVAGHTSSGGTPDDEHEEVERYHPQAGTFTIDNHAPAYEWRSWTDGCGRGGYRPTTAEKREHRLRKL